MNGKNIYIMCEGEMIAGTKSNEITTETELLEISGPKSGRSREYTDGRNEWGFTTCFLVLSNDKVKQLLKRGLSVDVQIMGSGVVGILQGRAILKTCKMSFVLGNLAQGSFAFVGNGPLEEYVNVSSITLTQQSLLHIAGDTETIVPTILPNNAGNKRVLWSSSDPSVAKVDQDGKVTAVGNGSCTITCAATDGSGVTATCNFQTVELVDLGLPSGTLWATCNIGANSPEEFGDHFAWAETEPKENYSWETYKYCEGTYDSLTKYCTYAKYGTVDDRSTLNSEDNVANIISNGKLWFPSQNQFNELLNSNYTSVEYRTNGIIITSLANGNSIILPYSPFIDGETPDSGIAYYWFNSISTQFPFRANALRVQENLIEVGSVDRYLGCSIGPVMVQPHE